MGVWEYGSSRGQKGQQEAFIGRGSVFRLEQGQEKEESQEWRSRFALVRRTCGSIAKEPPHDSKGFPSGQLRLYLADIGW